MYATTGRVVAVAAGLVLIGGLAGGAVGAWVASDEPERPAAAGPAAAGGSCDVAAVAGRVFPSLVTVNVQGGLGSGSILDTDGNILTNDHVIAPGAGGAVTVDFARGPAGVAATIVGRDPTTDLAVLHVAPARRC